MWKNGRAGETALQRNDCDDELMEQIIPHYLANSSSIIG